MLICFRICINLLRDKASNSELRYISFYINLFKGVEIDKNRRLSKGGLKLRKALFYICNLLKRTSFSAIFYFN